LVYQHPYKKL